MTKKVIAAIDDMFFAAKVRTTAEALGVEIKFHRRLEMLVNAAVEQAPDLILVDLHNEKIDALQLALQLKANQPAPPPKLLGFFSHVETELQRKALEAGYDAVIPRSVFSRDLASILSR